MKDINQAFSGGELTTIQIKTSNLNAIIFFISYWNAMMKVKIAHLRGPIPKNYLYL
ncbi:hypothetical protein P872_04535 [Rhodonellum psychrophilum GCM71 = DSM 17998]|uniref:Uncharacterized protein n=1 Tax=Rhodonellum psychrophilum GCM71 = DSM 17998 TaxID=1123057 RepID=U5BYC5_9BACT|nr:hypothetical protein P872_04535 [Rhodonellum psychrophilum GCM71 = DSM 17998]